MFAKITRYKGNEYILRKFILSLHALINTGLSNVFGHEYIPKCTKLRARVL